MVTMKPEWAEEASGEALVTAEKHSESEDLKLFSAWFCPFVQRVWIALETKGIPYQYIEVNPYSKPEALVEISPRGLVPAIRHGPTWSLHESATILEYLEELSPGLLPPAEQKQARADARLWADYVNRDMVPAFYRALQALNPEVQVQLLSELDQKLELVLKAADPKGPFFSGAEFGWVDIFIAPWILRLKRVLSPYRAWPEPAPGSRLQMWADAIEAHPAVKATTSDAAHYFNAYRRYAENRPNTSLVADAINQGRGLP